MITITAKQTIKADMIDRYHEMAKELVEKSRAEEGNVHYYSVQDRQDPRVHMFVEIWKDQAAIDKHNATEHFQRIVPQFAAMFDAEEVVSFYNVIL